jgi:hypothetical protein
MPKTKTASTSPAELSMEPESEVQLPADRTETSQRSWAMEGYWEDDLMKFAVCAPPDQTANEPWQETDRPLAASDF